MRNFHALTRGFSSRTLHPQLAEHVDDERLWAIRGRRLGREVGRTSSRSPGKGGRPFATMDATTIASIRPILVGELGGPSAAKPGVPIFGYHATSRRYKCENLQQLSAMSGKWRRGWDSNPRGPLGACALSRGVPSTTRPPLRHALDTGVAPSVQGFCGGAVQRAVNAGGQPSARSRLPETWPSGSRPTRDWKSRTAARVLGPMTPSGEPMS